MPDKSRFINHQELFKVGDKIEKLIEEEKLSTHEALCVLHSVTDYYNRMMTHLEDLKVREEAELEARKDVRAKGVY